MKEEKKTYTKETRMPALIPLGGREEVSSKRRWGSSLPITQRLERKGLKCVHCFKGRNKMLEDKRSRVLAGKKPNKREKSGWFKCEFQKLVHLGFENLLRTLPPPSQGLTLGNSCSLWPRGQAHHLGEDRPPPSFSSLDSMASQAPRAKSCIHF